MVGPLLGCSESVYLKILTCKRQNSFVRFEYHMRLVWLTSVATFYHLETYSDLENKKWLT